MVILETFIYSDLFYKSIKTNIIMIPENIIKSILQQINQSVAEAHNNNDDDVNSLTERLKRQFKIKHIVLGEYQFDSRYEQFDKNNQKHLGQIQNDGQIQVISAVASLDDKYCLLSKKENGLPLTTVITNTSILIEYYGETQPLEGNDELNAIYTARFNDDFNNIKKSINELNNYIDNINSREIEPYLLHCINK